VGVPQHSGAGWVRAARGGLAFNTKGQSTTSWTPRSRTPVSEPEAFPFLRLNQLSPVS